MSRKGICDQVAIVGVGCCQFGENWDQSASDMIVDAAYERVKGERERGASTISQQVAKNLFLWPDASFLRKGLEAYLTGLIELFWPKQRILEVYLNVAQFGRGVYGVEAASVTFFQTSAAELTTEQAATLRRAAFVQRARDRAAKRTLEGPHRSDLIVGHGPKDIPAKVCSTGEQKALLISLVLAHAALVQRRKHMSTPILLLDEIVAHLDPARRAALFDEILSLRSQVWMTGTDAQAFDPIAGKVQWFFVEDAELKG